MDSGTVELNTFTAPNAETNDDHMYSTEHPLYLSDGVTPEQNLKLGDNGDSVPSTENDGKKSFMNSAEFKFTLEILYNFYAELLVIIAGISLFTELIPGPIQLFESHVYIFILILCVGIVVLLYGVKRNLLFCNSQEETVSSRSLHKCKYNGVKNSRTRKFAKFYLKSTVFVFGFSVLISTSLESGVTFISPRTCLNLLTSSLPVLQCIFTFLQMIFVITSTKDTYNVFGCCHKLITMHLIATNIALCVRLFIWGSALDWENALHIKHHSSKRWERNELNITMHALELKNDGPPDHVVHITSNCWWRIPETRGLEDITAIQLCLQNTTLGFLWGKASRFFYPFMFQYYIVAVCFLFYITCNCKFAPNEHSSQSVSSFSNSSRRTTGLYSRSTKGLALGFLVLTSVIIYGIMYFVMENLRFNVILMSEYCFIFGLSTFAGMLCLFQIRKLGIKNDRDDIQTKRFQKMGLVATSLLGACNLVSGCFAVEKFSFLLLLEGILLITQTFIQYIVVVQITKRKVDHLNILEKPGRQCVAFLLLCNISLWVLDCFVSWSNIQNHLQAVVLGHIAWHIFARLLFPIIAFYRLHSSGVFFEAWKSCYF